MLAILLCVAALFVSAAGAKEKHHTSKKPHATQSTTGMGGGRIQNRYGGNPNAGGGPSGPGQATVNPGSSKPPEMQ
ncbi:hypothetical protein V1291_004750 [Nitrobacteraceae bacterium AZCC 1564]